MIVALLFLLTSCGASDDAGLSYSAPVIPITLTVAVDGQGHVHVSASVHASVVTPIGSFSVQGGMTRTLAANATGMIVSFRSGDTETDYEVLTTRSLRIDVHGHIVEEVTPHDVVINVYPRTTYLVTITDAHPDQKSPVRPLVDPSCGNGISHRERLPDLNGGTTAFTVDAVTAKLAMICLRTRVQLQHFQAPETTQPLPAGTVVEVQVPYERMAFLWDVSHNYATYEATCTTDPRTLKSTWGWAPASFSDSCMNLHEPVTVYSDAPAIVTVADGLCPPDDCLGVP